jgi:hypothetical protein
MSRVRTYAHEVRSSGRRAAPRPAAQRRPPESAAPRIPWTRQGLIEAGLLRPGAVALGNGAAIDQLALDHYWARRAREEDLR